MALHWLSLLVSLSLSPLSRCGQLANLQAALIGAEVALMLTFFGIKVGMARKKFNVPVRFSVFCRRTRPPFLHSLLALLL